MITVQQVRTHPARTPATPGRRTRLGRWCLVAAVVAVTAALSLCLRVELLCVHRKASQAVPATSGHCPVFGPAAGGLSLRHDPAAVRVCLPAPPRRPGAAAGVCIVVCGRS